MTETTDCLPTDGWPGGGATGALVRSHDWSLTPLGDLGRWPAALRAVVNLVLHSKTPACLAWGAELTQIFNDAYLHLWAGRHNDAMGQRLTSCWSSDSPAVTEAWQSALAGTPVVLEDQRVFLDRLGHLEEAWFSASFSPIFTDSGEISGVFHTLFETTDRVLAARRTDAVRDLAERGLNARSLAEEFALAAQTLADCRHDVPFALFFQFDPDQRTARLVAHTGLSADSPACPRSVDLTRDSVGWPLKAAADDHAPQRLDDLTARFGPLVCAPYPEAVSSAWVQALSAPGGEGPTCVVVLGLSPRLPRIDAYATFFEQLTTTLAHVIAHAVAYEALRARSALSTTAGERRYRQIVETAHEGIWLIDAESRTTFANAMLAEMLGYSPDEMLGVPLFEFMDDEGKTLAEHNIERRRQGINEQHDFKFRRKDGTELWAMLNTNPLASDTGEYAGALAMITDVTARRRSEQALRESEELLQFAGSSARLGAWSVDLVNQRITWSAEVCAIHEVPVGTVPTFDEAFAFYAPDSREAITTAFARCVADGADIAEELEIVTSGARRVWVNAIGSAVRNDAGEVVQVKGAFQDITRHKLVELELKRANRAMRLVSTCNDLLIRAESEQELLDGVCRVAFEVGGYRVVWVGYAMDDPAKSIKVVACSTDRAAFSEGLSLSWDADSPYGNGPAGMAIRTGEPQWIVDRNDPSLDPWRARIERQESQGALCLPLKSRRRTFGMLSLPFAEPRVPPPDEYSLLLELASNLAFGIDSLRAKEEQKRTLAAVLTIARGVSSSGGNTLFDSLNQHLIKALRADCGFIAFIHQPDALRARTVTAWLDGHRINDFAFDLANTPCASVVRGGLWVVERDLLVSFPLSPLLATLKMQAYVGAPLLSARGETVGMMVVLFREPITESEFIRSTLQIFAARAASELERQSADAQVRKQASMLDKAQDAILVRDLDHVITYWNKSAERLYGWSASEALGHSVSELMYKDPVLFQKAQARLLETGEWVGEMVHTDRAGRELTVSSRWTLVRDDAAEPQSVLSINTDITERKKLEQQFLRAQRMESIGTLAGGIAHDLNNVLTPIIMSIDLLKLMMPDDDAQELLAAISQSAARGASMVSQVLSFARGMEGRKVSVQARHVIRDVEKIVRDTSSKSIEVRTQAAGDLWTIIGDPTQLHQVLLNLCLNARDAIDNGGRVAITAENTRFDENYVAMNPEARVGPYVVIQVEDNGEGIATAILDKIFEPFFTTKEVGKGTGLGLSTSLAIIKGHGGFVRVHSTPGKGTRMVVYLPAVEEPRSTLAPGSVSELPRGRGELVLVIDDESAIRQITQQTLQAFGYRAMLAADGAAGVGLYAQHQHEIAAVITDMMMPIMDGAATIQVLKLLNPRVRIIASSGVAADSTLARVASLGVKHFIPKPFTADTLLKTLQMVLCDDEQPLPPTVGEPP